jgi:hypothetical protein
MLTKFNPEKSGSGFRISQMVTTDRIWINPEKSGWSKKFQISDLYPEKSGPVPDPSLDYK